MATNWGMEPEPLHFNSSFPSTPTSYDDAASSTAWLGQTAESFKAGMLHSPDLAGSHQVLRGFDGEHHDWTAVARRLLW